MCAFKADKYISDYVGGVQMSCRFFFHFPNKLSGSFIEKITCKIRKLTKN